MREKKEKAKLVTFIFALHNTSMETKQQPKKSKKKQKKKRKKDTGSGPFSVWIRSRRKTPRPICQKRGHISDGFILFSFYFHFILSYFIYLFFEIRLFSCVDVLFRVRLSLELRSSPRESFYLHFYFNLI